MRRFENYGAIVGARSAGADAAALLSFVASLQTSQPEVWQRALEGLKHVLPESDVDQSLVNIREKQQMAELALRENRIGSVPWSLAPAGLKQAVFLISTVVAAPEGALVWIEEPECNLHPLAQRRLMHFLVSEASEQNKQNLVCTHSLEMLDSPGWDAVALRERDTARARRMTPGSVNKIIEEWWNVQRILRGELGSSYSCSKGETMWRCGNDGSARRALGNAWLFGMEVEWVSSVSGAH